MRVPWIRHVVPGLLLESASGAASAATFEGVGMLGGSGSSRADGISPEGVVVVGTSNGEAFRWESGALTGLGFLDYGGGLLPIPPFPTTMPSLCRGTGT